MAKIESSQSEHKFLLRNCWKRFKALRTKKHKSVIRENGHSVSQIVLTFSIEHIETQICAEG